MFTTKLNSFTILLALLVLSACPAGEGGFLDLTIKAPNPPAKAQRLELKGTQNINRVVEVDFPPTGNDFLRVQYKSFPTGSLTLTLIAYDANHCPVASKTFDVQIEVGKKTSFEVQLERSTGPCIDAGMDKAIDGSASVDTRFAQEASSSKDTNSPSPDASTNQTIVVDGKAPDVVNGNAPDVPVCQPKLRDCTSSLDNDCNGTPDDQENTYCECNQGETQRCQEHPGKDGKGICVAGKQACEFSDDKSTSTWSKACTGSIGPAAAEVCDPEKKDENCDGQANEGCDCVSGTELNCGTCGGKAICTDGKQGTCNKLPQPRDCTSAKDNNCNGTPDKEETEFCICQPGEQKACDEHPGKDGNGLCVAGKKPCELSLDKSTTFWSKSCVGAVGPGPTEICDAEKKDENCDGQANDGCECVNGTQEDCGTCGGKALCTNGTRGDCSKLPKNRDCTSSLDNDCNGKPDNEETTYCKCPPSKTQECNTHPGLDGYGICKAGKQTCIVSSDKKTSNWDTCKGHVGPQTEICDAEKIDEDCDGQANDGCECVNGTQEDCGTCGGKALCTNGTRGDCSKLPKNRDCTSSLDNDCNGKPDNQETTYCKCQSGETQECNTHPGDGTGICKAGTQSCVLSSDKKTSIWGSSCTGAVAPKTETCDAAQLDEDCDGQINEGCKCANGTLVPCECGGTAPCANGQIGKCSESKTKYYRDIDKDTYGDPENFVMDCSAPSGYSARAGDCDDGNGTIKPDYTICKVNDRQYCDSSGTMMTKVCPDGCFNGECRTDGTTVGKSGWVSCYAFAASSPTSCPTSSGCFDGSCGPFSDDYYLACDGPNDCPEGNVCCAINRGGTFISKCVNAENTGCGQQGSYIVCDPLMPHKCVGACTKGTSQTSKSFWLCY